MVNALMLVFRALFPPHIPARTIIGYHQYRSKPRLISLSQQIQSFMPCLYRK